ncbi:flagellar type III secretion system protein FlhB [Pseudomonas panipatensis]|uniref:Flagellar biosynthetic protein FlhB n=1 Tax=Pseudomonas panipatensis TaxID=428992 RepID=A0A1G8FPA3_9PSED|nr:flagellar type III secretion system protein FlhB [Pseudomonas panipatensis]SDH83955.1 flagellar biosynthetic protein FlhB [Pseudomonas panipatensis]SMP52757.1 flagellar biosynthetic protein FlhB [Pseudomonas panipatensis]
MAEQGGAQEKTEEASEHKLRKSREQGQVARSKDLAGTVALLVTLLLLKSCAGRFYDGLAESFRLAYLDLKHGEIGLDDLALILGHNLWLFIQLLLPLLLTPLLVVAFGMIPGGWVFASANLAFKAGKLNPISGLARMFSAQNLTDLLKSLLKMAVLLGVAWYLLEDALPRLITLQRSDIRSAIGGSLALLFDTLIGLLSVFVLFALLDIPLQRFLFRKKMRMSKQERREEHKNQEGRPEVKARIRQVQRQMLQRQINRVLPKADVIVTNPQHFAVALKYDPKKAQAPFVLAKGVDEMALYIRQTALKHQLEVLELPPLARAIYFSTKVNQQIPAGLYTAVAHVLTYILQLRAFRQGRRQRKPELAKHLPIPDSLASRGQP